MSPLPNRQNWQFEATPHFKRLYGKKDAETKSKVDSKLRELAASKNPLAAGSKKKVLGFLGD